MKSAGDCEVVVLPKGRGGAVCRMSADAYIKQGDVSERGLFAIGAVAADDGTYCVVV